MAIKPQQRARYFQRRRNRRNAHIKLAIPAQQDKSILRQLQDALWDGAAITSILWNFRTTDWAVSVYAADIDNDGDIEILLASRDGILRAHTPSGAKKWEKKWPGQSINAIFAISIANIPSYKKSSQRQACVIVGMRDGQVYALGQDGIQIPDWHFSAGRLIRQIYVSQDAPDAIVIGAEDRCVHVLNRATGRPLWDSYQTAGWVRSVFSCDLDNDQRNEILAGSGDGHLYIFDDHGQLLDKLYLGHQIYALFAAPLKAGGPLTVITSSNRKELFFWTVQRRSDGRWVQHKEWGKSSQDTLFDNRIHTIYVDDVNNDQELEILLGSEDGYLYILDSHGSLLWQRRFGSCIYSIMATDINVDGQHEIIVGTEDSGVYVVQVELDSDVYTHIKEVYNTATQGEQAASKNELVKNLTLRERAILKDFIDEYPPVNHVQMEVNKALQLMHDGYHEQALLLLLRARQQKVQYCWSRPVTTHGYISTLAIGQLEQKGQYALIVGTYDGYVYAINAENGADNYIWEHDVQDSVRMLQSASLCPGELDSIVMVLSNYRMVTLDHQGTRVQEHVFENKDDWARSITVQTYAHEKQRGSDILIGLENNKVVIWDGQMRHQQQVINTPEGICIIATTAAITASDDVEIVCGSVNGYVYVYSSDGHEIWRFQAQDRIQAICIQDIDRDGHVEIIIGSDDRNVYVLSHDGHLKWRFRTRRGVSDVTVADIRLKTDVQDVQERKLEVLAASSDGRLYVLNANGDLLWTYQSHHRIKAIRARDINGDGIAEIALVTENRLELLQILSQEQIYGYIQECWDTLLNKQENPHLEILKYTQHSDEFLRAFSLAKLAGQHLRYEDDIKRFQEALRTEESIEVKKELVRAIIVFLIVPTNKEKNEHQARSFLRELSADPDPDIRLAIVNILPRVLEIDEGLCFEYLEYFTHNVDVSVRRTVVRQIDKLVEKNPERSFRLLLITVKDEEEWIRQETGRVLSHYFDAHPERIIHDSLALLTTRTRTAVLEQISYSSPQPAFKRWFSCLVILRRNLDKQSITSLLDETIAAIEGLQVFMPIYGDDLYQIYTEFRRILQTHSSSAIARYQWTNTAASEADEEYKVIRTCMAFFDELLEVSEHMRAYERRDAVGDRVTSLISATDKIEEIRSGLQQQEIEEQRPYPKHYYRLPEMSILSLLLEQYYQIIKAEINRLRGHARLVAEIRNKEVQREEEIVISLLITNKGVSAADNIRVRIVEVEQDFSVIGATERTLLQLPTGMPTPIEFKLKPQSTAPRVKFIITYDDAEKRDKEESFADVVVLHDHQRPYTEIANPYTSGTPIRDRRMFYGRSSDIDTLREKLSSVTANKVVVLSGQRRMGKTSLIYQLANELARGPQVPVLIDLQGQALQTMGQLFAGLALRVREEVQQRRQITLPLPDRDAFLDNPTESFDAFLAHTLGELHNEKLVFLLDEFEVLQEKINKGPLNQDVLHYLRSLMQHRQGLNFLLVGAPRIRHVTEPSWSIFFNIALQHGLNKLTPSEAQSLLTEPLNNSLEYDMLALERMHRLSGDLPYFIHVLSEMLIAYCNKHHKSYVTVNDVNNVLEIVLDEQTGTINWIWNQSSSPLQRFLLSVLAQDKGDDRRVFTFTDLYTEFDAQGVPYEQEKVIAALKELVREDIVEESHNGARFRLPVGLVKEWLRKTKPPERVVQDEALYDA